MEDSEIANTGKMKGGCYNLPTRMLNSILNGYRYGPMSKIAMAA